MGLPDEVTFPDSATTVFCLKKVKRGYKKSLNIKVSTYS